MSKPKYEKTSEYLEIKNWDKYQSEQMTMPWVKDYVDKELDENYMKLGMMQRYLFDGLCRLRGRIHKSIPNDPMYIARALSVSVLERNQVPTGLQLLINCGMVIPSNQQLSFTEESKSKKKKRVEVEKTTTTTSLSETPTTTPSESPSTPSNNPFNPSKFEEPIRSKTKEYPPDEVKRILRYWFDNPADDYWRQRINSVEGLTRAIDVMASQVPSDWTPPAPKPPKRLKGNPECRKCWGNGFRPVRSQDNLSMYSAPCECVTAQAVQQ